MKSCLSLGITSAIVGAGGIALAGVVSAAPTGPSPAEDTIRTLQSSGYTVLVNRTGSKPLSQCTVKQVRQGVTHEILDTRGTDIKPLIISDVVYVDLTC
ncbi:hypothetical protein C731_3524 [Mycolicibacterium hassiacum DSM 44199]|jgi:hypothetical protein|uniref:Uncharacterized protein n=1 Tax=Mycolicibacterium hassiacum (strain DSM 44199 / CIP 105218 / JCM 12690 / 3849) TaxID=1122247 RepID=K5BEN6_MYCHD|nr:hypothetical protein [Mycolicibacterium hassiacum]EKF22451.1 hypothetical protein C731_3524 [Mycolicibacterium hassiacum DSM 44199]MBX5485005.1 hypothetical protein [Mycolicibacterium hassiacum]MDA4084852.1 hypothetical protein [Mycolicibacterium hassiacum DSM 44199]PZN18189.1 MAG: hypothetical protein DIU75_17600 [Mycolicibacterium hassiacum]VCT91682.1 hypothetical protein MHAS_03400 [Mycolicibacterium hassiacum DSM 44199]